MRRKFLVEYQFTSTKADGDAYKQRVVIEAANEAAALREASRRGFSEFGAKFTDNCFDWAIRSEIAEA
jgi:hypothetical protein